MTEQDKALNPDLTIVTPMYNALGKYERTLSSLSNITTALRTDGFEVEVIFVDDFSTDGTHERLLEAAAANEYWRVERTASNTGSPSVPRNIGLDRARGEFVFFLDGDDEINSAGIAQALYYAKSEQHDLVRGPVEIYFVGTGRRVIVDSIPNPPSESVEHMIEAIAINQSLNCSALWRRSILLDHGIQFDPDTRMGEDLKFTAEAMSVAMSIGYVRSPLFTYVRHQGGGDSAMHHFGGRELREIVASWDAVETEFSKRGLSYLELHGDRTINYAIQKIIRHQFPNEISDADIDSFAAFFEKHRNVLRKLKFADPHVTAFVDMMCVQGASAFRQIVKPRLLIAGSDLKFILPAVPYLREHFDVRVDEWPSEILHNENASSHLLGWADYIWVEWLTSASVWYSERVAPRQRLVVRMHRYELGRRYGDIIAQDRVDSFVAIAPHCLEDMIERFKFPRHKVRFIPNYYMVDDYAQAKAADRDRLYRLAMIGGIPKRKGLLAALELLRILRAKEPRYTLSVLGKTPPELPWIGNDPYEAQYFESCDQFIKANDLEDAVEWVGWQDTRETAKRYGFVLSMSEHEGSHVGPGEAFCSGNQGVFLNWRGAEFVYPEDQVFASIDDIANHIDAMSDLDRFNAKAQEGKRYMKETYDIELFVQRVTSLYREMI